MVLFGEFDYYIIEAIESEKLITHNLTSSPVISMNKEELIIDNPLL